MRFKTCHAAIVAISTAALLLLSSVTASAAKYEGLYKYLKDIKGWEAEKAEGMQMDMPELKMIQVTREYKKDDKSLEALIIVGGMATMGAYMQQPSMKYEDDETRVDVKEIDGFRTHVIFDKGDDSGTISVILNANEESAAVFVLSFEGMSDDEALGIAKGFDWKAMKEAVEDL